MAERLINRSEKLSILKIPGSFRKAYSAEKLDI